MEHEARGKKAVESESSRLSALKETLWGPLLLTVDGVLAFLEYGDFVSKIFPSVEGIFDRLAILKSLPWYWKIIILLCANVLIIGEGAFRALRKRERQRDGYKHQLEEIEKAKPRIALREPGAIYREMVPQTRNNVVIGVHPFLKMNFKNDPQTSLPSAVAKGVRAFIEYYDVKTGTHLRSIDGRWADSDQPSRFSPLESKEHLLAKDFGIGAWHPLDIAYFHTQLNRCFAWNNDNYNYTDFVNPGHILDSELIRVTVQLRGEWVDERFEFSVAVEQGAFRILPN